MIERIGVRLARTTHREYRWRQIAVSVSVAAMTLLVLVSASIVVMLHREESRAASLHAFVAEDPTAASVFILYRDDVWAQEQYPVLWFETVSDTIEILLPGMTVLPAPGQAVLSPALHALTLQHPVLAARYPGHLVLEARGVRSGGSLLAYIRVPDDRSIMNRPETLPVERFGSLDTRSTGAYLGMPTQINTVLIGEGIALFLGVPGLLLLVLGAATASQVREHRLDLLFRLGMSHRDRLRLQLVETLTLALPAIILVTTAWLIVSPQLTTVPFIDYPVFRGDMALSMESTLLLELCMISLIIASTAAAERLRRGDVASTPRPWRDREAVPSVLRLAPMGSAILALITWRWIGGTTGATIFYLGVILALGSLPVLSPNLLRPLGNLMAHCGMLELQIAGRGIAWEPSRRGRPFFGVTTVMALALATTGYLSFLQDVHEPPGQVSSIPGSVFVVSWAAPHVGDIAALQLALGPDMVLPASIQGPIVEVVATCPQLSTRGLPVRCQRDDPYWLPSPVAADLTLKLGLSGVRLTLVQEIGGTPPAEAIVMTQRDPIEAEQKLRSVATVLLPGAAIWSLDQLQLQPSPLVEWLGTGLTAALSLLGATCLLAIVDRLLAARADRRHLTRLGVSRARLARLEILQFLAPYALLSAIGAAVGITICFQIVTVASAPVPIYQMGLVLMIALLGGAGGAILTALLGNRIDGGSTR